ncbi:MAG: UDP-2,4-diacetamido-2,4,6-trideoxy-beta-L-altropyranose hydrolase [Candidatus Brocadiaceae bacterium]|nr:UDP-2,4-diacetamido-2,4,6-trideoxy-beta-L-altropyranose hydrolase [Candidatus Brocadiaceae bacterium]
MNIFFRCNFGSEYGFGHLMRCIALAEGFQKYRQIKIFFITNSFHEKFTHLFKASGIDVITLSQKISGLGFNLGDYTDNSSESITLFDNYDVTEEEMAEYKKSHPNLVAVDDFADRYFNVDIIINQNIQAEKLNYQAENSPLLLVGTEYALLRKNVLNAKRKREKNRIFMSFGGGDVFPRIETFLNFFRYIDKKLVDNTIHIDFAISANRETLMSIQAIFSGFQQIHFNYITNSFDLSSIMARADFAITAAGSIFLELAYIGIPQMAFIIDKNQEVMETKMNENHFGVCPGYIGDVSHENFEKLFFTFLRDDAMKENMSRKGCEFIDGKGVDRVVERIVDYYQLPVYK